MGEVVSKPAVLVPPNVVIRMSTVPAVPASLLSTLPASRRSPSNSLSTESGFRCAAVTCGPASTSTTTRPIWIVY